MGKRWNPRMYNGWQIVYMYVCMYGERMPFWSALCLLSMLSGQKICSSYCMLPICDTRHCQCSWSFNILPKLLSSKSLGDGEWGHTVVELLPFSTREPGSILSPDAVCLLWWLWLPWKLKVILKRESKLPSYEWGLFSLIVKFRDDRVVQLVELLPQSSIDIVSILTLGADYVEFASCCVTV